jgi:hypothetical protein
MWRRRQLPSAGCDAMNADRVDLARVNDRVLTVAGMLLPSSCDPWTHTSGDCYAARGRSGIQGVFTTLTICSCATDEQIGTRRLLPHPSVDSLAQ